MFLTRLGINSKAVITGDETQIDLPLAQALRPARSPSRPEPHRRHRHCRVHQARRCPPSARAAHHRRLRRAPRPRPPAAPNRSRVTPRPLPMNRPLVAASRQSAAGFPPPKWRRSAETPLRQSSAPQSASTCRGALTLRNRQRTRVIDLRRLRRLALTLLQDLLAVQQFDLGIYLVSAAEITRLNEKFLRHQGSTDVITFNYEETAPPASGRSGGRDTCSTLLHGEIFICIDEAVAQAHRFRTAWQS